MIASLQPYPEYKPSGLRWLTEIPTGRNAPRTKTAFRLRIEKSGKEHGKDLLSIYTHKPEPQLDRRLRIPGEPWVL
jgi:hypothetical protein